jgi:hypothetical protein
MALAQTAETLKSPHQPHINPMEIPWLAILGAATKNI